MPRMYAMRSKIPARDVIVLVELEAQPEYREELITLLAENEKRRERRDSCVTGRRSNQLNYAL